MGARVLSALLVVVATPLVKPWSIPSVVTAVAQFASPPSRYRDAPQPFRISRLHMTEGASAQHLVKKVEPEYPPESRVTEREGDVIFHIIIGKNGEVKEIHLRRGKPILIKAAAKALSEWKYRPFILNSEAVEVESFATVRFRLHVGKVDSFSPR